MLEARRKAGIFYNEAVYAHRPGPERPNEKMWWELGGWVRCCPMPTIELADKGLHTWMPHHLKFYTDHQSIRMGASSSSPSKSCTYFSCEHVQSRNSRTFLLNKFWITSKDVSNSIFCKSNGKKNQIMNIQNIQDTFKSIGLPWCLKWWKKKISCNAGDLGSIPRSGRTPGERNGYPHRILAWSIPRTEKPGGL